MAVLYNDIAQAGREVHEIPFNEHKISLNSYITTYEAQESH